MNSPQGFQARHNEDRLTAAAREALTELVAEHRGRLLESTIREIPTGPISAADLVHAVGSQPDDRERSALLTSYAKASYEDARSWRRIGLLTSSTLLVTAFAALLTVLSQQEVGVGAVFYLNATVAVITILLAYTLLLVTMRQSSRLRSRARSLELQLGILAPWEGANAEGHSSPAERTGMFLEGWRRAERNLRALYKGSPSTEDARNIPLGALLSKLASSGDLALTESSSLRRMLRLRNEVVHGEGAGVVDAADVREVQSLADRLAELGNDHSRSRSDDGERKPRLRR